MPLDIMRELERAGAVILDRHFVYKSKKHGSGYINMDPLFPDVDLVTHLGYDLVHPFRAAHIDTIAGPATGGIPLAYAACLAYNKHWLPKPHVASVVWADKNGADFAFERAGFMQHLQGKRVLLVEDLLTTGGSVAKVGHEVEASGGEVVGVSVVCNRGGVTPEAVGGYSLAQMASVDFDSWQPEDCPLCKDHMPIIDNIGHGQEYHETNPDYEGGFISLFDS